MKEKYSTIGIDSNIKKVTKIKKSRRRFIAGASCPNCHAIDTLFLIDSMTQDFECVDCGIVSFENESVEKQNNMPAKGDMIATFKP